MQGKWNKIIEIKKTEIPNTFNELVSLIKKYDRKIKLKKLKKLND
jgi:hypothetical protein